MKMVYNIREYQTMFKGNKGSEENAIVAIIMNLLNNNKFDTIDNLLKHNENDFKTFLKNNKRDVVPLHYGSNLNNDDFKAIVVNFKTMIDSKLDYNKDNINTKTFDNREYIEYNGKIADNSFASKKLDRELKDMQLDNPEYQSLNRNQNTDKMMNELFNDKKREVEFNDLDSIEREKLNKDEQKIYDAALVQEHLTGENKKISLEDNLTKDDNNNITKLLEDNNEITISNGNEMLDNVKKTNISLLVDFNLSDLTSSERDIYLAALNYQIDTGEVVRLDLENKLVILPDNSVKEIITDSHGNLVVNDERMFNNESRDELNNNDMKEQELEKAKVKVLEYPNPYKISDLESA